MKRRLLSLAALALLGTGGLKAQTDTSIEKEVIIERRQNNGQPEKTIIIIDGDKVTVNGEEVPQLRGRLNGIRNGQFNFGDLDNLGPQIRESFRQFGPQIRDAFRNFNITTPGNRAMLGVNVDSDNKGAKVTEIVPGSSAEKAGLQKEDIITSINTDQIRDGDALVRTIGKYKPEDEITVTVLRNGKEKKLKAKLGINAGTANHFSWNGNEDMTPPPPPPAHPPVPPVPPAPRVFSFNGNGQHSITLSGRPKFGFGIKDNEEGDGAIVTHVTENGSAGKAGLKEGDIITEAAGQTVKTTDDLKRQLAQSFNQSQISMKVLRNGKSQNLTLKVPKLIKTAEL